MDELNDETIKRLKRLIKKCCKVNGSVTEIEEVVLHDTLNLVRNTGSLGAKYSWTCIGHVLKSDNLMARFLALLLTHQLFCRCRAFRVSVCAEIRSFFFAVFHIPGVSLLPGKRRPRAILHRTAMEFVNKWNVCFGDNHPELRLGMKFLESKLHHAGDVVQVSDEPEVNQRIFWANFESVCNEMDDGSMLTNIQNAANQVAQVLLLMKDGNKPCVEPVETKETFLNNDDDDESVDPDIAEWEAFERAQDEVSMQVVPVLKPLNDVYGADDPLYSALRDAVMEIKGGFLPTVRRWITAISIVSPHDPQTMNKRGIYFHKALSLKSLLVQALSSSHANGFHFELHHIHSSPDYIGIIHQNSSTVPETIRIPNSRSEVIEETRPQNKRPRRFKDPFKRK